MVRNIYQLDDNVTWILISMRLKERALDWFYFRTEYLTMSINELLEEMKQIFDLRPRKLSLRKEFEARVWKIEESFCDNYYEKMILANRVPIAEDELLDFDYLVDGIADIRLQHQARIMNFQLRTELLKAFEKINLDSKKSGDFKQKKDNSKLSSLKPDTSTRGKSVKCCKCQTVGHIATQCKQSATRRACYVCGSSEHLARDCRERKQSTVLEASGKPTPTTSTNLVQSATHLKPYMVLH